MDAVPSRHFASPLAALAALRADGVAVFAMETTEDAVAHVDVDWGRYASGAGAGAGAEGGVTCGVTRGGVALVLGNEEFGVDVDVIRSSDGVVQVRAPAEYVPCAT